MNSLFRSALMLCAPVLLASCSDAGVPAAMAPAAASRTTAQSGPDLSRLATFHTPPKITIAWAKKWIGPEGGRLEFHGFAVDVPAGAVDRVTQFSIHLPVDPQGSQHVLASFGPHGSNFAQPVRIEFPYAGTSIEGSGTATVVWWSTDLGDWVDMGGVVSADGKRLITATPHFSDFGTTDDSRGGALTSAGG